MKKHKYMENLSLKVIALFFAVFLWLIVINIDDPVDTQTFDNIPVEVKNEQVVKVRKNVSDFGWDRECKCKSDGKA